MSTYPTPMASNDKEGQPNQLNVNNVNAGPVQNNKLNKILSNDDDNKINPSGSTHKIKIKQRKPVEIYRILPTIHAVSAKTAQWVKIPGCTKQINVLNDTADIIVTAHAHGLAKNGSRVDLGIFVDGIRIGIDGTKPAPQWNKHNEINGEMNGGAISWCANWIPLISIASVQLQKGIHIINCATRNGADNNKPIHCNGTGMIIEMFNTLSISKWSDVDLNDKTTFFNKDYEYRIEIKGESFVYPMKVSSFELWFFYEDKDMNINPGFMKINYKKKRCMNGHYIVTKIQCCSR